MDPEGEGDQVVPSADFIEQIAAAQISKIAKSRSTESLAQPVQTVNREAKTAAQAEGSPSSTISPGSTLSPASRGFTDDSDSLLFGAGGFLSSGLVTPELSESEVIDGYGFVVPSQHEASYTAHCQKTAAMSELWQQRWATWVQGVPSYRFQDPTDAILAMTRGGIPTEFRSSIWTAASGAGQMKRSNPTLYAELVQAVERDTGHGMTLSSDVTDQINKDVPRSIPNNVYFRGGNEIAHETLKRVLLAYALHNMSVGYCQGMNVLAAVLLLIMPEEDAFFMLKTIVERILPSYFGQGLTGLTIDQNVIEAMMQDRASDLIDHLNTIGMPMHVVTTRWLMCIFVNAMPSEGAFRIWDCVILEGRKALFCAVMALFEVLKPQLLLCPDCDTAFELLQSVSGRMWDCSALVHLMNDTTPPSLFSKKPIGAYVTNERLQEVRNRVKLEQAEQERKLKEPNAVRTGFFSSVKNWTNKQVAKLQRMKKSANWLDDIVKLIQENGLALTHNPKGLAQALLYIDDPGSLIPDFTQEWSEQLPENQVSTVVTRSLELIWYLCLRWQEADTHAALQTALSQQLPHSEVFHLNATSAKWRPSFYMAFDHRLKLLVVAIRPSFPDMQLGDYVGPAVPFLDGFAHAGMVAGARWFVSNATDLIKQALQLHPEYTLTFVSHALGAGVALLTTLLLHVEQPSLGAHCHGFSSPACISRELTNLCLDHVDSVILEHDCIPALSLRRIGDLALQLKPGSLILSIEEEQHLESSMTEAQLQPLLVCAHESTVLRRCRGKQGEQIELTAALIRHAECSSDGLALSPSMFSNHGLPAYFTTLQLMSQLVEPASEPAPPENSQPEQQEPARPEMPSAVPSEQEAEPLPQRAKPKKKSKGSKSGRA